MGKVISVQNGHKYYYTKKGDRKERREKEQAVPKMIEPAIIHCVL